MTAEQQGAAASAILAVQSQVAYGHVGHSAALLPLQRLGFDVWPVVTVMLAHHPGYGSWQGFSVDAEHVRSILEAVLDRAPLQRIGAVLSGYLGEASTAPLVRAALDRLRAVRADLPFLCDPVIGNEAAGVFVRSDVPAAIEQHLLPVATIITPNQFELAYLAGRAVSCLDDAMRAAAILLAKGPELVVGTGLALAEHPLELCMLAMTSDDAWLVRTPRLAAAFAGAGDAFSALFLGHWLRTRDVRLALELAASAAFHLAVTTAASGEAELRLIEAQDGFVEPPRRFEATQIG